MGKSQLTGCIIVPVLDDVGCPFMQVSRSEPSSDEAKVFPRMVESFLTCATVDGVVAYGIRGGAGSQGRARARQRQHPRASPMSGEM